MSVTGYGMTHCDFEYRSYAGARSESAYAADLVPAGSFMRAVVAAAFGLKPDDLATQRRGRAEVAFARQVAMYLAHTRLRLPYVVVGRLFDRDRTTARHACRRVEDRREDPRLDSVIDHLERAIDVWSRLAEFS
jgi:Bacterial dnaA protein helix-turn-helix